MLLYRCLRYFTCVTLLITLHYCTNVTLCDPVTDTKRPPVAPSRSGSRLAMPMAQATGVSLLDDLMPSNLTPKSAPSPGLLHKSSPAPLREYTEGWVLSYTRKLNQNYFHFTITGTISCTGFYPEDSYTMELQARLIALTKTRVIGFG